MKTVIEMAREDGWWTMSRILRVRLERFAELVRADAIAEEREACVKTADDQWVRNPNVSGGDAIRSRSSEHLARSNT